YHYFTPPLAYHPIFPLSSHHNPTTAIYTPSLHDALPIFQRMYREQQRNRTDQIRKEEFQDPAELQKCLVLSRVLERNPKETGKRSEEHTSELQSRFDLVCRLLLEKKKYFW